MLVSVSAVVIFILRIYTFNSLIPFSHTHSYTLSPSVVSLVNVYRFLKEDLLPFTMTPVIPWPHIYICMGIYVHICLYIGIGELRVNSGKMEIVSSKTNKKYVGKNCINA